MTTPATFGPLKTFLASAVELLSTGYRRQEFLIDPRDKGYLDIGIFISMLESSPYND
jgi:hypothetical protein